MSASPAIPRYVTHDDFESFANRIDKRLDNIERQSKFPIGIVVTVILGVGAIFSTVGIATVSGAWLLMQNSLTTYSSLADANDRRLDQRVDRVESSLGHGQGLNGLDERVRRIEQSRFTGEDGDELRARINVLENESSTSTVRIDALEHRLEQHSQQEAHPWSAAQHHAAAERNAAQDLRLRDANGNH